MDNKIFQITSRLYNFKIWKRRNRVRFFRYLSMRRKDREVTNIIEEVVLIDHGKIILQDTVESLLETGYSVSGISHEVDQYCSDKNVIGHDELGNMKIAYILDNKTSIPQDSSLHFSSMNLQKLFVKLTEKGGK